MFYIVAAKVVAKDEHKVGGSQVQVKYAKLSDEQDVMQEAGECGSTLEVSNIPANVEGDYLQMYFENPKSGGCADCVKDITIVKPGIAHVQLTDAAGKPSMNLMCSYKQDLVCLMSQSWNNVANMYELLIVLKLTYPVNGIISLAVHMPIVSTVRMPAAAARTLTLLVLFHVCRPHPSMQVTSILELATSMAMFSLC